MPNGNIQRKRDRAVRLFGATLLLFLLNTRHKFTLLCGTALIALAACGGGSSGGSSTPSVVAPDAPTGVTAAPGNAQVTLSWPAVTGATSYNVYNSSSAPITIGSAKTTVTAPGATLSSLANGTVVYAAVTAVNAASEGPLSAMVCAVPTAAPTSGLTLYDPLCSSTLDGRKWRAPLFSRDVSGGALVLSARISNMESRTTEGQTYAATATVKAGTQRVSTLRADLTVPASTASRSGNAEISAHVQLNYQPPATRLMFPGGLLDGMFIQVGLIDTGSGLKAFRRVLHCDTASCASRSATGIGFADPGVFSPNGTGTAQAPAAYDTTYTVGASLDEITGILSWSIAGGAFGAGVSGTADPGAYLAGSTEWLALGANPLAGPGFFSAALRAAANDESVQAGSDGSVIARFGKVRAGFDNAAATLWDDFSGTSGNSGPTELSADKWTLPGTPGRVSIASSAGSVEVHAQATSPSTAGLNVFQGMDMKNPAGLNALQAEVFVSSCSSSLGGTNRASLEGIFYNDGTAGTTPPDTNQPNSLVGDIHAYVFLDCVADVARFQVLRWNNTTQPLSSTLLSNFANSVVPKGPAPIVGNTHTLTMKWDPVAHLLTFQVDGATPLVVDPTTVNALMNIAAPYAKPANAPVKRLGAFLSMPASATASMDFRVNNVFIAP